VGRPKKKELKYNIFDGDVRRKECSKCKVPLPFTRYDKLKNGPFGLASACKRCTSESNQKRRSSQKQKIREKPNRSLLECSIEKGNVLEILAEIKRNKES